MRHFTVYDLSDGRIVRNGFVSHDPDTSLQAQEGEGVVLDIEGDRLTERVVDGVVVSRTALSFDKTTIAADDTDTATLAGLPDPCTVEIDGVEHTVTGGTLEITSSMPATYRVRVSDDQAFPAQAIDVEITAT